MTGPRHRHAHERVPHLGVLLYELLTGALPFDRSCCSRGARRESAGTIRRGGATRARARRITQQGRLHRGRENRQTEPKRLVSQLRGDLDWITMKALEKDPHAPVPDRECAGAGGAPLSGR